MAWTVLGSSLVARTRTVRRPARARSAAAMGRAPPPGRPQRVDSASGRRDRNRGNQGAGRARRSKEVSKPVLRPVPVALESTRATVDLDLEHRRKGLLWYATYAVAFKGTYTFRNPDAEAREIHVRFPLPAQDALFDDFVFTVDGRRPSVPAGDVSKEMTAAANAAPGAPSRSTCSTDRAASARGPTRSPRSASRRCATSTSRSAPTSATSTSRAGTVSPSEKSSTPRRLGTDVGLRQPDLRPGDRHGAARQAEPGSLRGARHVLRACVAAVLPGRDGDGGNDVGTVAPPDALLVHRRRVLRVPPAAGLPGRPRHGACRVRHGRRRQPRAWSSATCEWSPACAAPCWSPALPRLVFLVLFSYAFFFEGFTGLAITVGAIVTLFVLMQMTARVSWDEVFRAGR